MRIVNRPYSYPLLLVLLCLTVSVRGAQTTNVMTYIYDAPESSSDVRYQYHWTILKTALERTRKDWGDYEMRPCSQRMTEDRQRYELKHNTGKLTVIHLDTTPDMEDTLIPIRIPVDKNLSGYFVFLIRRENQPKFDASKTLDDLRQLSFGQGESWVNVGIMRSQGFQVVAGSDYDGLFQMLMAGRFDAFPRSSVEVLGEYDARKAAMPDLGIEQHILFYYPMPMYFWFAKSPQGKRLANRAEEGMRAMIADGAYDRIFDRFFRKNIELLQLKHRRVFAIKNPDLDSRVPFADKRLWFDPQTYQPGNEK